jgi:hypothetical protein
MLALIFYIDPKVNDDFMFYHTKDDFRNVYDDWVLGALEMVGCLDSRLL